MAKVWRELGDDWGWFLVIAWAMWNTQNGLILGKSGIDQTKIVGKALELVQEYKNARQNCHLSNLKCHRSGDHHVQGWWRSTLMVLSWVTEGTDWVHSFERFQWRDGALGCQARPRVFKLTMRGSSSLPLCYETGFGIWLQSGGDWRRLPKRHHQTEEKLMPKYGVGPLHHRDVKVCSSFPILSF